MSYGLKGCDGRLHGLGRIQGLGFDYYDLLAQAGREDCDPRDSGCVMRNSERVIAVQDAWSQYLSNPATATMATPQIAINLDTSQAAQQAFMSNQPLTTESISVGGAAPKTVAQLETTGIYAKPAIASAAAGAKGGTLQFTTSRGGTTLYPGDTWTIRITGASPNAPVTVVGGKGSAADINAMGATDANGNFQLSGTITADTIGSWHETWSVGGVASGSFTFTVQAAPAGSPAGGTTGGTPSGLLTPGSSSSIDIGGFSLSSIPWWGWLGAAGVALFALGGKGGR